MKILVDKAPAKPEECLFKKKKFRETNDNFVWSWGCNIDNKFCDFEKGHRCNKLKEVRYEHI